MNADDRHGPLVPPAFASRVATQEGPAGAAWIARLPGLVAGACDRWQLQLDGPSTHGHVALVIPVRTPDLAAAMLKVSWPHPEAASEAAALRHWAGHGAVRLLAEDAAGWVMLLERLHGDRTLTSVPDADVAVTTAAGLLGRLHVDPPPGVPTVAALAARWIDELGTDWHRLGRPVDRKLLVAAIDTCRTLGGEPPLRLLHGDFHYDNVLAADRDPWLAIDPKPLIGDPAFEVVPLLRNRWADLEATGDIETAVRHRFDAVVDTAALDRDRARAWAITRAVDDTLWATERSQPTFARIAITIATALDR